MNQSPMLKDFTLKTGIDYHVVLDIGDAGISIYAEIEGQYKVFI